MAAAAARSTDVVVVGAGIGGLTLALALHRANVACRVYDSAEQLQPLGVGINVLPHATAVLETLGVLDALERVAVVTREAAFFNRFGQLVYVEPAGRFAGHAAPQLSIHRGDLQALLLAAVRDRLGDDAVVTGHVCVGVDDRGDAGVRVHFRDGAGTPLPDAVGSVVVGCDGIHSALRKQLHPAEGPPRWSGVNMWRGVVAHAPFLSGATMVRAGWLSVGKMVIYPIRDAIDGDGRQLVNWVAELESDAPVERISSTETVLAYPMVDQDPLPRWSFGRVTLLGDAAHPMVPRGSNGAGQAILDAVCLAERFVERGVGAQALAEYDAIRNPATAKVVLANRSTPPDAILREVHERSGDKPFARIEDVVSREELARIAERYKEVAGLGTPAR